MAVGFTPKHKEEFPLTDLTAPQYISLALSAAESLEWQIFDISSVGFKAQTRKKGLFGTIELIKFKVIDQTVSIESSSLGNEMVDLGRNKKHVNKLLDKIQELQPISAPEELDKKYKDLEFIPAEFDDLQKPPATTLEKFKDFFGLFKPQQGYFITPIIVNINILVFIAMVLSGVNILLPDNQSLIDWGANFKQVTIGQPWRLLTNCFLHIGIIHLVFNMYALIYIGLLLEPFLGKIRLTVAYVLTGIAASVISLWWHDLTISAGASGAIFGMYGVFLAMLTTNLIDKDMRKELLASIGVFVVYNLVFGMKSGIDNAAHIGGLLSGIVIGYAMIPSLKQFESQKIKLATVAGLCILVLSSSFAVYKRVPNNLAEYDRRMEVFMTNESQALEIFTMPKDTSKEDLLYAIKDRGIYYWKENMKIVKDLDTLELPEFVHKRNALLIDYCEMRIKFYELIYKSTEEGDDERYKSDIEFYAKKIEGIMDELKGEE